jgi:predicted MFS family arabinose efflux permease
LINKPVGDERDRAPSDQRALAVVRPSPAVDDAQPHPSRRSLRGLDWFIFFVADIQTGFGPFLAVYLTSQKWTQVEIGLVLSAGGVIALMGQMPGGALVDAARSERFVAGVALSAIATAALAYAFAPIFPIVLAAACLHAAASCVLGPCIVAMSLGLVGHDAIGERLGRNARFAAIGNGTAAAAMGAVGYLWEPRAVFFVTAILLVPTLIALSHIRPAEVDPDRAHGGPVPQKTDHSPADVRTVIRKAPLLILAGCALLFHMANASMLPLMGSVVTMRSSEWATVLIAACIVVPQVVVALVSPWIGHHAQIWGRLPFLRMAFAALIFRALLFAVVTDPYLLVAVQILDGITAAAMGVMVPLMIADITRGTGRFNLAQGIVGTAVGIGASISPTLAGYLTDHFGSSVAFFGLAAVAAVAFTAVWALMPETRKPEGLAGAGGRKK